MFNKVAQWVSYQCGRALAFGIACATVLIWAATGPLFHYSDSWQLVINTGTTIVTFLMVFLIQNTQTRDTAAIKLQLGELIHISKAPDALMSLDKWSEAQLAVLAERQAESASKAGGPRV